MYSRTQPRTSQEMESTAHMPDHTQRCDRAARYAKPPKIAMEPPWNTTTAVDQSTLEPRNARYSIVVTKPTSAWMDANAATRVERLMPPCTASTASKSTCSPNSVTTGTVESTTGHHMTASATRQLRK
jgi:hypothetical protein